MIGKAKQIIKKILYDEVLDNTYGAMLNLRAVLSGIPGTAGDKEFEQLLLEMHSESLRGALHKHEIPTTNSVITEKNRILDASSIEIPESHQLIDASKYANQWW